MLYFNKPYLFRHFNPRYQDISFLTCSDISTHDIKTCQTFPVQTFQPTISRRFNPYLFRHFNPCFEHFKLIKVSFLTPFSKTSQPVYRRRFNPCQTPFFTGNTCDNCPIKTVFRVKILRFVC